MDNSNSTATDALTIIVRLLGLVVLLVGLYIGIRVIFEAWHLYQEPQRIERFATAIEHGSHLDSLLASFAYKTPKEQSDGEEPTNNSEADKPQIKMTYFLAWGIAVLLLMVVGSLASTAIRTGGQLALYDLQIKQLAKQLQKEAQKK